MNLLVVMASKLLDAPPDHRLRRFSVTSARTSVNIVMVRNKPAGRLLGLNGGSSAGKTTLGRKLQSSLSGRWLLVGIDALIWTLPVEMVGAPNGIQIIDGDIRRGPDFMRLYAGFHQAVASLVSNGIDVILDDVLLGGIEDQRRWDNALGDLPVCWVAVHCDPETAVKREQDRGDRPPGIARAQAESVHLHVRYDIELDTSVMRLADSINLISNYLRDRWSISSARPTDTP
jgi:chloramphenicol 3-O phosphotransferase